MYKITNKSISIGNQRGKNRMLNNYLDFVLWRMLPRSIGDVLFTKFADLADGGIPIPRAFLQLITAQTITDNSTSMQYDVMSSGPTSSQIEEVIGNAKKSLFCTYDVTITGMTDGDLFTGLGFGRNPEDETITSYLFSFVDIYTKGTLYDSSTNYNISRYDEISTKETIITGDAGYLPGKTGGTLESITMCYGLNGTGNNREYFLNELTFARVSAGNVSVTGFDDFYIEDDLLLPNIVYPNTNYTTQAGEKIKSVKFRYKGNDDSATKYETYINIEDLGSSYSETDMSINLVCERG